MFNKLRKELASLFKNQKVETFEDYLKGFEDGKKVMLEYIEKNCLNCHKNDCDEVQWRKDPFYLCKDYKGGIKSGRKS